MSHLRRIAIVIPMLVAACSPVPSAAPITTPSTTPSTTREPSQEASRTPSPSAQEIPSKSPTSWREVYASDRVRLTNIIVGPDGFMAAGCRTDEDGNCEQGFVVSSPDGDTWSVREAEIGGDVYPASLRVVGNQIFALGYGHFGEDGGAVVSRSFDGRSWTPVVATSFRGRSVRDFVVSPLGAFAVGYEAPIDSDNTSGFLLWPVRSDGTFDEGRVAQADGDPHLVTGVIWTGLEFLAWGLHGGPSEGPTVVLASPDGGTWTKAATFPGPTARGVSDILAVGDRRIAVGVEGPAYPLTPRAWTSEDGGRTWTLATVEGNDAAMLTVGFANGRLVARGGGSYGSTYRPVSWESTDGTVWTQLPADDDLPAVPGFMALERATIGPVTCVAGTTYDDVTFRGAAYCH